MNWESRSVLWYFLSAGQGFRGSLENPCPSSTWAEGPLRARAWWLCTWPVIFQPLLEHFPCLKKSTTLPGKLFHCWTPLLTRKDGHKTWVRKFCLLFISSLSLSITFIFLQQPALPIRFLLSTQDPLLLLVAFFFFFPKSKLLLDFCLPWLFIWVPGTLFNSFLMFTLPPWAWVH